MLGGIRCCLISCEIGSKALTHAGTVIFGSPFTIVVFLPSRGNEADRRGVHPVEVLLFVTTALVLAMTVWVAFRAALQAEHLGYRVAVRFAAMLFMNILQFTLTYNIVSGNDPGCFSEDLSNADAFYFTMSVLTTTEFGDITAVEGTCRRLVAIQMIFNLALFSGALVVLLSRLPGRTPHRGHR